MVLSRRALALLALLLALPLTLFLLLGAGRDATAQSTPLNASPNITQLPAAQGKGISAISAVFSRSAPFVYVSGLDTVSVFDVTDPRNPQLKGKLVNPIFQNEAMTLGERIGPDGKVQRFVLVGNDLANASVNRDEILHVGRLGGQELIIVDVTDPANPKIAGRTPSTGPGAVTSSTHTVACMNAACTIAYTAGGADDPEVTGKFGILDLTDITKPKQIGEVLSPAAAPNPVFTIGSGHHWNVDGAGIAWHAGSGGTAAFDISDPKAPKPIQSTDKRGIETPLNDFIHHNSQRPNATAFKPGQEPSVANGNVILIGEEDYANDGDELECSKAGTFQTWQVNDLDAAAYRAANPKNEAGRAGTVTPLDAINPPTEGGGLTTPAGAFCSVHWFDYHQSGTVAIGNYQQGLRLVNVRNPRDLKQVGFVTGGASEVWDAYWVPQRDAKGATVPGKKTNIIYTVDAVRGLEVFEVKDLPADLPVSGDAGDRGTFPAAPGESGAAPSANSPRPGAPCGKPDSKFTKGNRIGKRGVTLRGVAFARGGCEVRRVEVAVAKKAGKKCRFLKANGRLTKRRSCSKPVFLRATGTKNWTYAIKLKLPRGSYLGYSRAADSAGAVESWGGKRKILKGRVR